MRSIKFKAWDTINEKWINLWHMLIDVDGNVMALRTLNGEMFGLHQIKLVQFTCLHDKNGKEIFGGDILLGDPQDGLLLMEWIEGVSGWAYEKYQVEDCEIIGSIYEKPELLRGEK